MSDVMLGMELGYYTLNRQIILCPSGVPCVGKVKRLLQSGDILCMRRRANNISEVLLSRWHLPIV